MTFELGLARRLAGGGRLAVPLPTTQTCYRLIRGLEDAF